MIRALLGLSLACGSALLCASPARADQPASTSTRTIELSQFGYATDVSFNGPTPQFQIYIPVHPQLRSIRIHLPIEISSVVDQRATINVKVNGSSVFSTMLGSAHRRTLDLPIVIPKGARTVTISVGAVLFRRNDVCGQLDNASLWMRVSNRGTVRLTLAPIRKQSVADFLSDYGGRFNVVVASSLPENQRLAALQLAYALHALNRWRYLTVTSSAQLVRGVPNVVFAPSSRDLVMQGNSLNVSPAGLPLFKAEVQKLLLTTGVSNSKVTPLSSEGAGQITLRDLGIANQTVSGDDELPVSISLSLGQLGGTPSNLQLHVDVTHTPLAARDRGQLRVYVNGSLADAFDLSNRGGEEHFDASIEPRLIESVNNIRIVPTYVSDRPCRGAYPMMIASVLNSSALSWDGLTKEAPTIGDFFGSASGRVVVLLADPSLSDDLFTLLDKLGADNTAITSIDFAKYGGSIPIGYDYAIVLAPLDQVAGLDVPFKPDRNGFRIVDPADNRLLYSARYTDPFGVLQTTHSGTPALVVTYWKDAHVLRLFKRISPAWLADVHGNVLLFNSTQIEYTAGTVLRKTARPSSPYQVLFAWLFAVLAAVIVLLIARALWRRRYV